MSAKEECGARKHKYEFKGNKLFKTVTQGARSTRVRLSVNAVYVCETCGKVRRGPGNRNHPWPSFPGGKENV